MGPNRLQLAAAAAGLVAALGAPSAHAAIPAGYQGKPFDPAVAGGDGIIPASVKAGPYAVPGRIDLVNYDLGGEGVAYHSEAHYTTKDGDGYRDDRPTATMCKTATSKPDLWYDSGAALDGKAYPADGAADFYIGSIHPNDWFNYTVDVKVAGKYAVSSTFSTGNGPPGGEGGDGQMELVFFVNGVQQADWKTVFPDYQNKANFHLWKAYQNIATLTLEAGLQVIKIQAPFKHLNLDYLDIQPEGGAVGGAGGAGGAAGAGATTTGGSATGGSGGAPGSGGTNAGGSDTAGSGGTASNAAGTATSGGSGSSAGSSSHGDAGTGTTPPGTNDPSDSGGCSCRVASAHGPANALFVFAAVAGLGLARRLRQAQRARNRAAVAPRPRLFLSEYAVRAPLGRSTLIWCSPCFTRNVRVRLLSRSAVSSVPSTFSTPMSSAGNITCTWPSPSRKARSVTPSKTRPMMTRPPNLFFVIGPIASPAAFPVELGLARSKAPHAKQIQHG
jgi:MYXO-CTERM domain-containing protein